MGDAPDFVADEDFVPDQFQISKVPSLPSVVGDTETPDSVEPYHGVLDPIGLAAAPAAAAVDVIAAPAESIVGNEIGAIGKNVVDGLLPEARIAAGIAPEASAEETAAGLAKQAPTSIKEMGAQTAAQRELLNKAARSKYTSRYADGGVVEKAPDFIPDGQFQPDAQNSAPNSAPDFVPDADFKPDSESYGGTGSGIRTAVEQSFLGLPAAAEVQAGKLLPRDLAESLGATKEAVAGRASAHPYVTGLSSPVSTTAALVATGGLSGLAEGAGLAAQVGAGATEGAALGGLNAAADDWSQDKALDGEKLVASAGLGAILGGTGGAASAGIGKLLGGSAGKAAASATEAAEDLAPEAGAVVDAPAAKAEAVVDAPAAKAGVHATSIDDMIAKVNKARAEGNAIELPQKAELAAAVSRVPMENPVTPLQLDSVGDQAARTTYGVFKESDEPFGETLRNYEGLQKSELVDQTDNAIRSTVAPRSNIPVDYEPISDAARGGRYAINAFKAQYQAEKAALAPVFENLKNIPIEGDPLADVLTKMTEAVPGISQMVEQLDDGGIKIKPYSTAWGIDRATYAAAKDALTAMKDPVVPSDFQTIWNIRKGLDQNIDPLAQGQAESEIRALKAGLMDYMQEAADNPDIREAFKRYAINEQKRAVIEEAFGASVGNKEFGAISKVKPEMVGDKIFANTATVNAAKSILPPEQFNKILSNWLAEARQAATDKGAFSSNKFASFLRRNQDALNEAFSDNPQHLQYLKDLMTIQRILPDAASINPSGTAKTLMKMLKHSGVHNLTYEGMLAKIPQVMLRQIDRGMQRSALNKALAGQAAKVSTNVGLKKAAQTVTDNISRGARSIFLVPAEEKRDQ